MHHVYAVYGRLSRDGGAGGRIDCGRTASLTGARRARRRRGRETFRRDVTPFCARGLLAQAIQVFGVTEVEVGLGQRSPPDQIAFRRFIAGHRRPVMVVFPRRSRVRFHVVGCKHTNDYNDFGSRNSSAIVSRGQR